jgi:hypothetical protein
MMKMENQLHTSLSASLPIKHDLKIATALTIIVAILMTAASVGGLLFPDSIYPTDELRHAYLANDAVNLLVGLPILLSSMWLARRGKLIGLLCWPGAFLYTFYNYIAYVVGMPISLMTLVFVSLVLLSAYPMMELLNVIDRDVLKERLAGVVYEKISGGVLVLFGVAFFFLAAGVITGANADQGTIPLTEVGVAIADIILSVLLSAGGVLLFLRKSLGYASGLGLLFAASALFIGVILVVVLQPALSDAPFVFEDIIALAGMGLICFIPTGLFTRGVITREKSR